MQCFGLIQAYERNPARQGRLYERVLWSRIDMTWVHEHPPLRLLPSLYLWVPYGEDFKGLNDRHAVCNRTAANVC